MVGLLPIRVVGFDFDDGVFGELQILDAGEADADPVLRGSRAVEKDMSLTGTDEGLIQAVVVVEDVVLRALDFPIGTCPQQIIFADRQKKTAKAATRSVRSEGSKRCIAGYLTSREA